MAEYYYIVIYTTTSCSFIHQWTLRLFPCNGYCKYAVINKGVHVSFWVSAYISFGYIFTEVELLDHMVVLFSFENPSQCFPYRLYQFINPQNSAQGSSFFISTWPVISCLSENKNSKRCEVLPCCGFDWNFSDG